MSETNLEQQIEKIKLAMDNYLEISQSDDHSFIIDKLEQLMKIGVIDELRALKWIAKYDSQNRDDSWVRECVALYVFNQIFSSDKSNHKTLWSDVKLGLSVMDSYNKETKKVNTHFFNAQTGSKLFEELIGPTIDDNKTLEKFNELIKTYFEKANKIILKKIKNSTNEVGKIEDDFNPYLSDLIIKRSKNNMSKEFNILKSFYNSNSNKDLIPKPVAYFHYKDGYNYLIMRETDAKFNEKTDEVQSLAELLEYVDKLGINSNILKKIGLPSKEVVVNFKVKYLEECLKNLGKIQKILNTLNLEKKQYDFRDIVKHKISKRLNNKELVGSLEFLVEKIESQEKCFTHGDYHPGNILVKNDKIIPIDFECVNYLPVLYDVAFLLEHKKFIDLNEKNKKELVAYFLKSRGMNFSFKEAKDYDYMALFINLRWASISSRFFYSLNDRTYKEDIGLYIKKSNQSIDNMITYSSGREYEDLKNLKGVLNKLDVLQ